MAEKSNQGCTLCGDSPKEGMHLSGQRALMGKLCSYMICKSCCLQKYEYGDTGINRKVLWDTVDKELLNKLACLG